MIPWLFLYFSEEMLSPNPDLFYGSVQAEAQTHEQRMKRQEQDEIRGKFETAHINRHLLRQSMESFQAKAATEGQK